MVRREKMVMKTDEWAGHALSSRPLERQGEGLPERVGSENLRHDKIITYTY